MRQRLVGSMHSYPGRRVKGLRAQLELQSMAWLGILFLLVFAYLPMYGIVIAFQDFSLSALTSNKGIISAYLSSPWVGLKHFKDFLTDDNFGFTLRNTLGINLYGLLFGFPLPIIFALLLNEMKLGKFKKFVQTVSYLPYFVSWIIFGGLIMSMLSTDNGIVNHILLATKIISEPVDFMATPGAFWPIAIVSGIIKSFGFSSVLYISAIASVDVELYEAAEIDGCGRLRKMLNITLPAILGTIAVVFIFSVSGILNTGFDQIIILQNPLNIEMSETIDTYVYKVGLGQMRYSYSAAVGLSKSIVALVLLYLANWISKKVTDAGLF